jgi:hypothetical protein
MRESLAGIIRAGRHSVNVGVASPLREPIWNLGNRLGLHTLAAV